MSDGRYQRYPEYKDSGVEWLGILPKHWKLVRLKYASELKGGKVVGSGENQYVGLENIESKTGKYLESDSASEGVSESFSTGEILFGKLRPYLAKSWLAEFSGVCSSEFLILRNRLTDSRFLNHFMLMEGFIQQVDASTYGSKMPRASWDFIGLLEMPCPPLDESAQIAAFLDHETAKIDLLIEKQQELIRLLKEKRQAVISHAVTKGLNPHAPLKDSGVEWLGQVPEHWGTTRLKYCTTLIVDCPHETPIYSPDGNYMVIRTADIAEGKLDDTYIYRVSDTEYKNRVRRAALSKQDIVYGREGERWGHAALVPEKERYCLGQRMMQFRVTSAFDPIFIMWQLCAKTTYCQGEVDTVGATSPHVNVGTIKNFSLTAPPLSEQIEIGQFLNSITNHIDDLMRHAQVAIELMQERRTALVSAAVTGKIDVRHWQPTFPSNFAN